MEADAMALTGGDGGYFAGVQPFYWPTSPIVVGADSGGGGGGGLDIAIAAYHYNHNLKY
jgi:hypothetical protein